MNLTNYLTRVKYSGLIEPTKDVLFALHRSHLAAISYENLDIHLGNPVTVDIEQIFDKIVHRGRGGWCFEMNGLFAWALREIGFDVTMYAATVGRKTRTNSREGDHLVLKVALDQPYLADVGFGTGFYEPLPLAAGEYQQDILDVTLRLEDESWHFADVAGNGPGYDFPVVPQTLESFADACDWLQTSPESGFVRATVCQRVQKGKIGILRGAVFITISESGSVTHVVESLDEYKQLIHDDFGLTIANLDELWGKVWAKHQQWLKDEPNALS